MRSLHRGVLSLGLLMGGLALPVTASAQDEPAATTEVAKRKFEAAERAEKLRYRHLWIAYGAIWFIVFGFAFRTWQRTQATGAELDELKRRLAELEGRDG